MQHRLALAVVDRVGQQVPQNALDAARVDGDDDALSRHVDDQLGRRSRGEVADRRDRGMRHTSAGRAVRRPVPRHRHRGGEISSRSPSSDSNRSSSLTSNSDDRRRLGFELVAAVVDEVGGHAHGRQRGAQLVADIRGEPLLQIAELFELGDLLRQALGHLVERHRQPGHVVLAAHGHSFLEPAVGESHGDPRRRTDRADDLPRHEHRDRHEQHEQHDTTDEHRAADQRQDALFAGQREDEVQLETVDIADAVGVPTMSAGPVVAVGSLDRRELVGDLTGLDERRAATAGSGRPDRWTSGLGGRARRARPARDRMCPPRSTPDRRSAPGLVRAARALSSRASGASSTSAPASFASTVLRARSISSIAALIFASSRRSVI